MSKILAHIHLQVCVARPSQERLSSMLSIAHVPRYTYSGQWNRFRVYQIQGCALNIVASLFKRVSPHYSLVHSHTLLMFFLLI